MTSQKSVDPELDPDEQCRDLDAPDTQLTRKNKLVRGPSSKRGGALLPRANAKRRPLDSPYDLIEDQPQFLRVSSPTDGAQANNGWAFP